MINILYGIVLLALGGLMTFNYGRKFLWRISLIRTGMRTTAKVADIIKVNDYRHSRIFHPRLRYTAEGKQRTVQYRQGESWLFSVYRKGQTVTIAYNKNYPKDIVVVPELRKVFGDLIKNMFWLAITVGGMLLLADGMRTLLDTVF